jgi:nicotinate-nucleotide--dimethylbenzimidazole phosphoribosyltransferase
MQVEIKKIIAGIKPINETFVKTAYKRIDNLTKPKESLGRLEEIAAKLYAVYGGKMPKKLQKAVYVFAGDHGVTAQGVSAYPKDVTYQMVFNFLSGGAAINVLSRHAGADVYVVDAGVDFDFGKAKGLIHKKAGRGTKDFTLGPAMTEKEAVACIMNGFDIAAAAIKKGYNLLAPGDMGIGNTTASSAVLKAATGANTKTLVGYGTGIDDKGLKIKIAAVDRAMEINKPKSNDALDILKKVGGFEIGSICGFILGCAYHKTPVVVDGFISSAGAALAYLFSKNCRDYLFFSHSSVEKGHKVFYDFIQDKPIFDLNLRLGEGTGAALAFSIIEASAKIYNEMATFEEAAVSRKVD